MNEKVVLAMVTYYPDPEGRDKIRFTLALNTVRNAVAAEHGVVVVDDSPSLPVSGPYVSKRLAEVGARVFPQLHRCLGPAKRQSFFHALELCVARSHAGILATEAEKDMAPDIPRMLAALEQQDCSICVPRRTSETWPTWPTHQQRTEKEANAGFEAATNRNFDVMFGPVLFTLEAASHFVIQEPAKVGFPDQYAQHFALEQATFAGRRICECDSSFTYPAAQRAEEEGALSDEMRQKRIRQRDTLITGYEHVARFMKQLAQS